jgi:acyl carrier protein
MVLRMNDAEVYVFLKKVFRDVFDRDDVVPHPTLTSKDVVGWDSLRQVEIILALEEKYGIRIRTRELNSVANVGDLVALVRQKVGAAG